MLLLCCPKVLCQLKRWSSLLWLSPLQGVSSFSSLYSSFGALLMVDLEAWKMEVQMRRASRWVHALIKLMLYVACWDRIHLLFFIGFQKLNATSDYGSLDRSSSIENNESVPLNTFDQNSRPIDEPIIFARLADGINDKIVKDRTDSVLCWFGCCSLLFLSNDGFSDKDQLQTLSIKPPDSTPIQSSFSGNWAKLRLQIDAIHDSDRPDDAAFEKFSKDMTQDIVTPWPSESFTDLPDRKTFNKNWAELKSSMESEAATFSPDSLYQVMIDKNWEDPTQYWTYLLSSLSSLSCSIHGKSG